jgi:carbamate kinase
MSGLAVVAIGGNSLVREHDASIDVARAALDEIAGHLAEMVRDGWALVVTHGNGPQVGFALLRWKRAPTWRPASPSTCSAPRHRARSGISCSSRSTRRSRSRG